LRWFLGISVIRDRTKRTLWLSHASYINKLVSTFHLEHARLTHTLMSTDNFVPYNNTASPQAVYSYQRKMGSILYAATISRLDIARATNKLMEYMTNPSPIHHAAADRIICYLSTYCNFAIQYSATDLPDNEIFACSSAAAFADNIPDRKSSEAYLF
jgi:hypothetical protein